MTEVHPGPNGGIHKAIGAHGARLDKIETDVHEMKEDVREIRDIVVKAKGAWKLLAVVAMCSGSIGAGISWAVSLMK